MKKKLLAMLMTMTMVAMSLAGCGSKSADNTESASANSGDATYSIGVIQLVQHSALDAATEGFVAALEEKLGDSVSIDVQNAAGDSATCSTIANQFVSEGVDLIMANATPALQSAMAATADIPILGTSVTDYATALEMDDWTGTTGINVSGTSDLAPLDQQADMLEELFPVADNANVGILYCTAEANSKYQADVITKSLEAKGYNVTEYTFSDSNDVASVVTAACAESDVLYVPTDNTAASCAETINSVAAPAGVPIIAGEEGICAGCGVATLSISYYDLGYQTGLMAYDVLVNGTDVSSMEVQFAPEITKEYNADLCDQLGIKIPDGYVAIATEE